MVLVQTTPPRLWTPGDGLSGLVVVARTRPLLAVVGHRVVEVDSDNRGQRERREAVTLGGLVIINASRRPEPKRVVGHPDLASGTSVRHQDRLYVSVAEAVYRQSQGEEVEIHLMPTEEDKEALTDFRARARRRWESDRLPDGWTRPLPPPAPRMEAPRDESDLPRDLRELAERIRAKTEQNFP